jgi:RND family efflux transporter MFP subunit
MILWIATVAAWASAPGHAAEVAGVTEFSQRVELSAPVSGTVQQVMVDVGQRVKRGEILVALDPAINQARVQESEARVRRLEAEAAEARRELDRQQELYNRTVISTSELDLARLHDVRAAAHLAEARANLKQERKQLADTTVRAPFDAVVVARMAEPGQTVAAGLQPQPLVVVARAGEMLARVLVGEDAATALRPGAEAKVSVNGQSFAGRVKRVGLEPVRDSAAVEYPVEVVFAVAAPMPAGLQAQVDLP